MNVLFAAVNPTAHPNEPKPFSYSVIPGQLENRNKSKFTVLNFVVFIKPHWNPSFIAGNASLMFSCRCRQGLQEEFDLLALA